MSTKLLTPRNVLIGLWLFLPVLAFALHSIEGSLRDGWRAQPPTDTEVTDCRIDAMMGGDNPVEVERRYNACTQAANDAYVRPRTRKTVLIFTGLVILYAAGLGLATWKQLNDPGARAAAPKSDPSGSPPAGTG